VDQHDVDGARTHGLAEATEGRALQRRPRVTVVEELCGNLVAPAGDQARNSVTWEDRPNFVTCSSVLTRA
jgi:hypothetical protein